MSVLVPPPDVRPANNWPEGIVSTNVEPVLYDRILSVDPDADFMDTGNELPLEADDEPLFPPPPPSSPPP